MPGVRFGALEGQPERGEKKEDAEVTAEPRRTRSLAEGRSRSRRAGKKATASWTATATARRGARTGCACPKASSASAAIGSFAPTPAASGSVSARASRSRWLIEVSFRQTSREAAQDTHPRGNEEDADGPRNRCLRPRNSRLTRRFAWTLRTQALSRRVSTGLEPRRRRVGSRDGAFR